VTLGAVLLRFTFDRTSTRRVDTSARAYPFADTSLDGRNEPAQTRSLRQIYSTNSVSHERHHNDEHLREVTANGIAQVEQLSTAVEHDKQYDKAVGTKQG
jgi:hypothetical protein